MKGGYALRIFVYLLVLFRLLQEPLLSGAFPTLVETDLFNLRLSRNAAYTEVSVARELNVWPRDGRHWFEAEYVVRGQTYYAMVTVDDADLARLYKLEALSVKEVFDGVLRDPIAPPLTVVYDKTDPSRYIIGETTRAPLHIGPFPLSLLAYFCAVAAVSAGIIYFIIKLIVIKYVIRNGKRILVKPIAIRWGRYPEICRLKCRRNQEHTRYLKGWSAFRIDTMMKENAIQYIPAYVLPHNSEVYYIDCDELKQLTERRTVNGYSVDELKATDQDIVWPKMPWFFSGRYRNATWIDKV